MKIHSAFIALSLISFGVAFAPPAVAEGCDLNETERGCNSFTCSGELNKVDVVGSVSSFFLQWRTIEVRGYCGAALVGYCVGAGSCAGTGEGPRGGGACAAYVGQGVDFSAACSANEQNLVQNVEIKKYLGFVTATKCSGTTCVDTPVECIEGANNIACAVGFSQEELHAMFPDI